MMFSISEEGATR